MSSRKAADQRKSKGIAAFFTNHRRAMILLGATITLGTYFLKDVLNERTKEKTAAISAGSAAYLASTPELRAQLNDLFNGKQMLKADPTSVIRNNMLLIGDLTLRAQTNTLQLSAFLRAMPDAISLHGSNVDDIMK